MTDVSEDVLTFDQLLKQPLLLKNITQTMGFQSPTPIQSASIPIVLKGLDIYAGAKTGSGKTIAFLAPIAERILNGEIERAIVLAPTRELVLQIDEEAMRVLEGQSDLVSIPLYGGVPVDPQILAIRTHRPRIFIVTPGRCLDLHGEGFLPLDQMQICVLDEADRMCDMGFAPQVSQILDLMTSRKQTLLFSATLPQQLTDIMGRYCPSPERIQVDAPDRSSETIFHKSIFCPRKQKSQKLTEVLKSDPQIVSVTFVRTRHGADQVFERLSRQIRHVGVLHAGLPMSERERTLRDLREGRIRHLVATDVFARGIDVEGITHVVHYDLPTQLEDFIHRSGRSGRAGREGTTISLVESDNSDQLKDFKAFSEKIDIKPWEGSLAPSFDEGAPRTRRGRRGGAKRGRPAKPAANRPHLTHSHPAIRTANKDRFAILGAIKGLMKKIFGP